MRHKVIIVSIYSLIIALMLSLVFVLLLFSKKVEDNKLVSKDKSFVEKVYQEKKVCLPQKVFVDKKVYVDRVVYQEKIVYREKVVYVRDPKKIRYGLSLIKTTSSKDSEESYLGLGLKIRYDQYYSLVEILENRSLLLSLGYEF